MATARKPKAQANSATILNDVARAGWNDHANRATVMASVAAAQGLDPKEVRAAFCAGFLARDLYGFEEFTVALDKARAVLALPGATGKAAERRTGAQETSYAAARKAWARYAPKAGLSTGEKRGTKSASVKKAKAKAEKIAPKFKTVAGSLEWAQKSVAFLLSGLKKNAAPAPVALAADALAKAIAAEIAARK
jgi:hypothetical protein